MQKLDKTTHQKKTIYNVSMVEPVQNWMVELKKAGACIPYFAYLRLKKWVHNCAPYDLGSTIPGKRS